MVRIQLFYQRVKLRVKIKLDLAVEIWGQVIKRLEAQSEVAEQMGKRIHTSISFEKYYYFSPKEWSALNSMHVKNYCRKFFKIAVYAGKIRRLHFRNSMKVFLKQEALEAAAELKSLCQVLLDYAGEIGIDLRKRLKTFEETGYLPLFLEPTDKEIK